MNSQSAIYNKTNGQAMGVMSSTLFAYRGDGVQQHGYYEKNHSRFTVQRSLYHVGKCWEKYGSDHHSISAFAAVGAVNAEFSGFIGQH